MHSNPNCNGNRRDKAALRTTCIKMSNLKLSKQRQVVSIWDTFTTAKT